MIQKLQRKIVLINMALVTLVLLIVFGALFYNTYQRGVMESETALRQALDQRGGGMPPRLGGGRHSLPTFVVSLANGEVMRDLVSVTDAEADAAVSAALATGEVTGNLSESQLRFERRGDRIAFCDVSSLTENLASTVLTLSLSLLAALGAFLGLSIVLARVALAPAARAWARERQFIYDASHELKTPLTVILTSLTLLDKHPEDPTWLQNTRTEAERMKRLVDDLLFLARAESARPRVCQTLDLSALVWGAVLPFEAVAFEKHLTLQSEIVPDVAVAGDPDELHRLVAILVDNACKYAADTATITLTANRVLTVANTGTPISPDVLPHVFERFYRADTARTGDGAGLGLAIAAQIAARHGAKLTTASDAESTRFSIAFPLSNGKNCDTLNA